MPCQELFLGAICEIGLERGAQAFDGDLRSCLTLSYAVNESGRDRDSRWFERDNGSNFSSSAAQLFSMPIRQGNWMNAWNALR
jgi:hypothetical protein